jgi:hypothetical protein
MGVSWRGYGRFIALIWYVDWFIAMAVGWDAGRCKLGIDGK